MKLTSKPCDLEKITKAFPSPRVLVPTMGALHEGHLTLVRRARKIAGKSGTVILTLFVNPTQFDKAEDLDKYPRTLDDDLDLCRENGVDVVFAPEPDSMYHPDHSVTVIEAALTGQLCGATRPGHFDGVCTVVLKLINLTQPDTAIFGKKDYQQLVMIKYLSKKYFNDEISIISRDTIRENSGLAMSSRNNKLTLSQKNIASFVYKELISLKESIRIDGNIIMRSFKKNL
jgi:pantoate--beta-alanine ligase